MTKHLVEIRNAHYSSIEYFGTLDECREYVKLRFENLEKDQQNKKSDFFVEEGDNDSLRSYDIYTENDDEDELVLVEEYNTGAYWI